MYEYKVELGDGPVVFTFQPQERLVRGRTAYHTTVTAPDGAVVFDGRDYSPSPLGDGRPEAVRSWAEDVAGFASAYVERPEEFSRSSTEAEQVNAAWWRKHGDVLSADLAWEAEEE